MDHMAKRRMQAGEQVRSLILGMTRGAVATALRPQPAAAAKRQNALKTPAAMAIVCALAAVLMPSAQAQTYTVLHNFTGGQDGSTSFASLTMDRAGNFYGTTYYGGSANRGVVFKLTRKGAGFVFSTLHSFGNGKGRARMARSLSGRTAVCMAPRKPGPRNEDAGGWAVARFST